MSRAFLTGGGGFIGAALARALVADGVELVALARSDGSVRALEAIGARVTRGDVLDPAALAQGMEGCEFVYHVAGVNELCPTDPAELFAVNIRGADLAVRAAARAGVARFVLTSSAATIGEPEGTVGTEETVHRGDYLSVYERTKHEGEIAAFAAARATGIDLVAVNPCSVQGPGRATGTAKILIAYLNDRLPVFVDRPMSIVDIDDCVQAHLLAASKGVPGERYLICGGTVAATEALALVQEIAGRRRSPRILPTSVARSTAAAVEFAWRAVGRQPPVCREMVAALLHGHRYDGSRAERELGLQYTPLRETLRRTIAWAENAGLITTD